MYSHACRRVHSAPNAPYVDWSIDVSCVRLAAGQAKIDAGDFGPRKQAGEVADIVPAYLFLASPEAKHMLGQTVCPSGGHVML